MMKSAFALALIGATVEAHYYGGYSNVRRDPWGRVIHTPTKPTGWYSATSQYYNKTTYTPQTYSGTQQGVCVLAPVSGSAEAGSINLTQLSGKSMALSGDLTGLVADTEYEVKVNQFGSLGTDCADIGALYNPLSEPTNTFAEPGRGEADNVTAAADGTGTISQASFLQNLGGSNPIWGKSMSLTVVGQTDPSACCVIV